MSLGDLLLYGGGAALFLLVLIKGSPQVRLDACITLLVVWTIGVIIVTFLGIGFAGGVWGMFTADNYPAWLLVASPIVPLALWLRERARYRAIELVEKRE